jgi:integrase
MPPDPLTGERKVKYIYGESGVEDTRKEKQKVRALLNEFIDKVEAGDFSDTNKLTVEGYLNNWIDIHAKDEGISPTTEQGYRIYISKHVNPILGKILLNELRPLQIEAFYKKEKKKGYSEKTILQIHRIMHKAFRTAVKNGIMHQNVCDLIDKVPSPDPYKINVYNQDKFNDLLDAVKGTYFELPVLLAGGCGLRRGEVLGLRWNDIDFENSTITVEQTAVVANKKIITKKPKSKKSARTFTVPSEMLHILKQYKGIGLVCPGSGGKPMHGGTFSKRFSEMLSKHELEHIRFHDLRHFNATMMLKYGISKVEAANRLGHSDPAITEKIYQHVLEEMDQKAANKLNSIFNRETKDGVKHGVKGKK